MEKMQNKTLELKDNVKCYNTKLLAWAHYFVSEKLTLKLEIQSTSSF